MRVVLPHEILRVTLGGQDPPVHNPPSPGRSAASAAAAGRTFSGTADGRIASKITIRHGFVKSTIRNARFIGDFTARLTGQAAPGDEQLGLLGSAKWHGRFTAVRNRATQKVTMSGLLLATFTDPAAGRACLRLRYKNARSRSRGTSTVTILGGEGGARTLAGSATVRVRLTAGGAARVSGRVRASRGPARGFPAQCTRLEKAFGLAPLAR